MQLEGKIMGYSKKTLAIVIALVLGAGIVFYAGAKYEKNKLMKLKLLGKQIDCSTCPIPGATDATTTTGSKKSKKANTEAQKTTTPSETTNNQSNTNSQNSIPADANSVAE